MRDLYLKNFIQTQANLMIQSTSDTESKRLSNNLKLTVMFEVKYLRFCGIELVSLYQNNQGQ